MIKFTQFLTEKNIRQGFVCSSKKRLFETIARIAAETVIAEKIALIEKNIVAEQNAVKADNAAKVTETMTEIITGTMAEAGIVKLTESAVENSLNLIANHKAQLQAERAKLEKQYFDCLLQREKLGSSALGGGVAMPKARLLEGEKVLAVFIQLETPVDYEAADHREVDLILALFVPEKDCQYYGQCLPELMDNLADRNLCKRLRTAQSEEEIWHILKAADAQSEQNIEHHTDHLLET